VKTLVLVMLAAALAVGCDEKKGSEGATPSATVAASAAPSAAPAASVTAAASATAAPSASAAAATPVPTPEQYEQKAAAIQPTAAETELSKIEKEIGP
jgi:hypothetical protein